jgi:arylsulfatase A-like enzyme
LPQEHPLGPAGDTGQQGAPVSRAPRRRAVPIIICVILLAAGAAALVWWFAPDYPTTGSGRTNLILISVDTLRADHLACYGYPRQTSPTIDSLARQGTRFHTVAAQAPWTLPSHVSMVTGLYPHRHGVTTTEGRLAEKVPTLATLLAREGFATGALTNSEWLTERQRFNSGFHTFEYISEWSGKKLRNCAPEITDKAIRWIRKNDQRPFFLFVHYYDVHSDYQPDEAYRRMFVDPSYRGLINGSTSQLLQVRRGTRRLTPDAVRHVIDLYDGEIRQLDDQIARLLRFLDRRGRSGDTCVVFTADHGEEFLEHGSVLHGRTLFDEVIAVPLIIRGPNVPAANTVTDLVQLVDLVPTALGLLGLQPASDLDGHDLRTTWTGANPQAGTRLAFAEADWQNAEPDIKRMVRSPRFKLVYDRLSGARQLYDLQTDPRETRDVITGHADVAYAMIKALATFTATTRPVERAAPLPQETIERLKSLGYLQ